LTVLSRVCEFQPHPLAHCSDELLFVLLMRFSRGLVGEVPIIRGLLIFPPSTLQQDCAAHVELEDKRGGEAWNAGLTLRPLPVSRKYYVRSERGPR
jgi:hypothetical protein